MHFFVAPEHWTIQFFFAFIFVQVVGVEGGLDRRKWMPMPRMYVASRVKSLLSGHSTLRLTIPSHWITMPTKMATHYPTHYHLLFQFIEWCEEAKVRCCLLFDFALICQPSLKCIQFFAPIYVQVIKNVMARKDAGLVLFYWPLMMNTFNFLPPF